MPEVKDHGSRTDDQLLRIEALAEERIVACAAFYIVVPETAEYPIVSCGGVDDVCATGGIIARDFRVAERDPEDGASLHDSARESPIEGSHSERAIAIDIVVSTAGDYHVVADAPEEEIRSVGAHQHIVARIPGKQVPGVRSGERDFTRAD